MGFTGDRREIPRLRKPTIPQERDWKEKASACFARNDRFVVLAATKTKKEILQIDSLRPGAHIVSVFVWG
jgi:hypothetical protein